MTVVPLRPTADVQVTELPPALGDCSVTLVTSVDEALDLMRWLSTKTRIGLDTENTGLSPENDHVRLVQFGDDRTAYVVPFERWGGVVEEVVRRYDGLYDTHNGPYDGSMLDHEGIHVPRHRVHDTRVMAHVIDSTGSLALKKLADRHVDVHASAGQQVLEEAIGARGGWTWATVPIDYRPYWMYAGLDTILTTRVRQKLEPIVMAEAPLSYQLELAVQWVTERMERRGLLVDREYTETFAASVRRYVDETDTWVRSAYGFGPGQSQFIEQVLLRDGCNLVKRTASGARYSLDKEVLAGLDHPLAAVVLGHRHAQKLLSTYLETYLELSAGDGRVHPRINSVGGSAKNPFEPSGGKGVRTGRMSCDTPNLQNVPIRTAEGKTIRNCFLASPGNRWIKCDADQIEMRIMAHLADDEGMIRAFTSEGDFFVNVARELFAEPDFRKSDPRRQLVKNGGYAKIYSAGIATFARTAHVTEEVGAAFMQRFDLLYPGVPAFTRGVERLALQRRQDEGLAYVRSPITNRRHVADPGREYALVNYLIQGAAGEVLKMKMLEADAAGLGPFMVLPVHDEIDLDVPRDDVDAVLATLRDVMNDDKLLSVPLTWSSSVADRWGACE